jgi:uncharacterized membrane protein
MSGGSDEDRSPGPAPQVHPEVIAAGLRGEFGIDDSTIAQVMRVTAQASSTFIGPLPPPAILKGYDEVVSGCAERMLAMAERQAAHRQELETLAVGGGAKRAWAGMWLGFVISVIVMVLGFIMVITDHDAAGIAAITIDVVSLAGVFVYGRLDQRRERVHKAGSSQIPATGPPPD